MSRSPLLFERVRDREDGARGIVMAGGRSERMRATNGPRHKALVDVAGRPLLEHNLRSLFDAGLSTVVVAIAANEPELADYLAREGSALAAARGARLEVYVETRPLGNIGAVGPLSAGASASVVTFVDNLTTLDPAVLLARHRECEADLTLATHLFALHNAFGELELADGFVRAYREKPVRRVRISSGAYVVGPRAAALIPPDCSFGASHLCTAAIEAGLRVAACEHDELWVDVNDSAALAAAQTLLRDHPARFLR